MNKYIVFSGLDGCGKTTQSENLVERLKSKGHKAIWTREPGSPLINLNVRDFVLSHEKLDKRAEELLYQSDRAEHTAKVKELLNEGFWVVSDRSYFSGLAYALASNRGTEKELRALIDFSVKVYPDKIFFLDTPVEECMKRQEKRKNKTREESKGRAHFEKIRDWFLTLARDEFMKNPSRMRIIETEGLSKKEVAELIDGQLGEIEITGSPAWKRNKMQGRLFSRESADKIRKDLLAFFIYCMAIVLTFAISSIFGE